MDPYLACRSVRGDEISGPEVLEEAVTLLIGMLSSAVHILNDALWIPILVSIPRRYEPSRIYNVYKLSVFYDFYFLQDLGSAHNIPCIFEANKVWMTLQLFKKWLHSFDAKLDLKNHKIVFFVDHCAAHSNTKHATVSPFMVVVDLVSDWVVSEVTVLASRNRGGCDGCCSEGVVPGPLGGVVRLCCKI
ncbi:hypothetical protein PR048_006670 [Dryococelus australis]|uniref:DDE-1 domain-containing protein n=1 Tax=Dryococelus australis TaxID=614101 RepID=A0ABQ9IBK4_9NEOP|nr:hypothetical protein PR048_006670 [Dryococelus australis]